MKKIIITLTFICILTTGAFGQMINTRSYAEIFGFRNANINISSRYVVNLSDDDHNRFGNLSGEYLDTVDTLLEFAISSYYSTLIIQIRPPEADAILPANNPRLSDQKLGAAVFQEIQTLRFLGDTAAVNRHEAVLQYIIGRGNATRAEIETFYRNNIRALISQVVDEELNTRNPINSDTRRVAHEIFTVTLVNFYLTTNQANYDILRRNIRIFNEIVNLKVDVRSVNGIANLQQYGAQGRSLYSMAMAGLYDTDAYIRFVETYNETNRDIAQILRRIVVEGTNQQSRLASQEFGISNTNNVDWSKINWYEPILLLNQELARKVFYDTWGREPWL